MPKKKTGQRKKAEKGRERQKLIRAGRSGLNLMDHPANAMMECSQCNRRQKIRAFCYFCQTLPRLPQCCHCGKQKCTGQDGACLVRHSTNHVIGMQLVGAICDFCEAWVCHGATCIKNHSCECPMRDVVCVECERSWLEHGGRIFRCAYCDHMLCEDDQFEHQASCQRLESESYKCPSCNRVGTNTCLRCKLTFCDDHVRRKGFKYERGKAVPCPRCTHPLSESYSLSVSTRSYDYGRQAVADYGTYGSDVQSESNDEYEEDSKSSSSDQETSLTTDQLDTLNIS